MPGGKIVTRGARVLEGWMSLCCAHANANVRAREEHALVEEGASGAFLIVIFGRVAHSRDENSHRRPAMRVTRESRKEEHKTK